MSYYILLAPELDISDRSLILQLEDSMLVEGLAGLKERLKSGENFQVVRVHHSVISKRSMKPDEILAHYPSLQEAIKQEQQLHRRDLSYFTSQLLAYLDEPESDSDAEPDEDLSATKKGKAPSLGAASYALTCLSSVAQPINPPSLDSTTLGLSKDRFFSALSANFPGIHEQVRENLHQSLLYTQQVAISRRYTEFHILLEKSPSIFEKLFLDEDFEPSKIMKEFSCGKIYLVLNYHHSFFISFRKEDDFFIIEKFELSVFSCLPKSELAHKGKIEFEAYKKLIYMIDDCYFSQEKFKPFGVTLLQLNLETQQLSNAFEEFQKKFKQGERVWGRKSLFQSETYEQSVPSHRNCHSFVYALLQIIVAQRAAKQSEDAYLPGKSRHFHR